MARTYKQPSLVSGMTVNDILNMDEKAFNKLNLSDMRKVVGRLVSAGNKRIRSFEKSGASSPAYRQVIRSGGAFSTQGKNLNQLRAEYMRAKSFLTAKSGSKREWEKIKHKEINTLKKMGIDIDEQSFDKFWKSYEKLKETSPEISEKKFKYEILKEIGRRTRKGQRSGRIVDAIQKNLTQIYERVQETEEIASGVSSFFEQAGEAVGNVAEKVASVVSKVIPK